MATDAELEAKLTKLEIQIAQLSDDPEEREKLVDAYNERGRTLGRLRRFAEADAAFLKLIDDFDDDEDSQIEYLVAVTRHDRVDYFARAELYGDALETAEQFLRLYVDDPPRGRAELVIRTLRRKAAALWKLGDIGAARAVYEDALAEYGDETRKRTRVGLITMIDEAGDFAREAEQLDLALHFYDTVLARVELDEHDEDLQYYAACSTFSKAIVLGDMDRPADANELWQRIWNQFRDEPAPPWPTIAEDAHYNEAWRLHQLGLNDLAATVCEELLSRREPGESDDGDAVIARTVSLLEQMIDTDQPPLQIVAAGDRLLGRIGDGSGRSLRWEFLDLMRLKYWWLLEAVQIDEAIAVSEELIERFADATDANAIRDLGKAITRCAYSFSFHSRFSRQRRKPALRLVTMLMELPNGRSRVLASPPLPGGPTGLLAATIAVRRKCRTQSARLYSVVIQRLEDSESDRLRSLSVEAMLGGVELSLEGGHLLSATQDIWALTSLGTPAADAIGRRIRAVESSGAPDGAVIAYKVLRAMALDNDDTVRADRELREISERYAGNRSLLARLLTWSGRGAAPADTSS